MQWPKVLNAPLAQVDPELYDIIEKEKNRQFKVGPRAESSPLGQLRGSRQGLGYACMRAHRRCKVATLHDAGSYTLAQQAYCHISSGSTRGRGSCKGRKQELGGDAGACKELVQLLSAAAHRSRHALRRS